MKENGSCVRTLCSLIVMMLLAAATHAQQIAHNGTYWKDLDEGQKLIFINAVYTTRLDDLNTLLQFYKQEDSDDEKRLQDAPKESDLQNQSKQCTALVKLYRDAITLQRAKRRLLFLKTLQDNTESITRKNGLTASGGEIESGIDTFYRVPANLPVCMIHAVVIEEKSLTGHATSIAQLEAIRKTDGEAGCQ